MRILVWWYMAARERSRPGGKFPNDAAMTAASLWVIRRGGEAVAMERIAKLIVALPGRRHR